MKSIEEQARKLLDKLEALGEQDDHSESEMRIVVIALRAAYGRRLEAAEKAARGVQHLNEETAKHERRRNRNLNALKYETMAVSQRDCVRAVAALRSKPQGEAGPEKSTPET